MNCNAEYVILEVLVTEKLRCIVDIIRVCKRNYEMLGRFTRQFRCEK